LLRFSSIPSLKDTPSGYTIEKRMTILPALNCRLHTKLDLSQLLRLNLSEEKKYPGYPPSRLARRHVHIGLIFSALKSNYTIATYLV
jgi:hypothetical protein